MYPMLQALLGGALIGAAASGLLLINGRSAGVGGILSSATSPRLEVWQWAFLAGMVAVGVVAARILMSVPPEALRFSNELRMVIYGAILVVAVLAMPQGVAGWLRERRIARLRETLQ